MRVFTISYGDDADAADAAGDRPGDAARRTYNASNPATIDQVFTAVISNF